DVYKRQPELHSFILPGQTLSAAQLHVARAVCRRGERLLTELSKSVDIREEVRKFVNRLSDCLYICLLYTSDAAD
ncbi:ATP:cob(I)alamin adenosyltransferase, partial [Enterococcus sp. S181_ASV_20]|nr:ATP:cob(I)alamin adenosyltransferase [Enterococcus sp. S181_ASV_20]